MQTDRLETLTPAQREAVCHMDGPLLILAGPGSGKTRVVTRRIAYLLDQGVSAHQVLALTFTNKAADEMSQRVSGLCPGHAVWMGTFHRFCSQLLRHHAARVGLKENFTIYDTNDSLRALQQAIDDESVGLVHFTPERIARVISWAKNTLTSADGFRPKPGDALGSLVARIYPAYQRRLLHCNAVDFDDLLLQVSSLLRENPEIRRDLDDQYRYIMVDEYQDTNLAQYTIVRALSIDHPNLAVTGDPDQSIYGWRGANLNNILNFEKDYPRVRVVRLEQNYRSTPNILRLADQLISHNRRRKEKGLFTDNAAGAPVRLVAYPDESMEARDIARQIASSVRRTPRRPRDFAIFYRVNALSRVLEHSLREQRVPYQIVNGVEFYQRKEIKDVMAYLQLVNNPSDDVAFSRIINVPPRGIGKKSIERLSQHARRHRLTLFAAAQQCDRVESLPKRSINELSRFVAMLDRLAVMATSSVGDIVDAVLSESGYRDFLNLSGTESDQERLANVEELLTAARQFDESHAADAPLELFLQEAALTGETDPWEPDTDKVTLMTMHAAKGLEFPVVYVVAVEQGLVPHERSKEDENQLEEERRLLFVAITRAEKELQLSLAKRRTFRGATRSTVASPFLMEMPRDEMEVIGLRATTYAESDYSQACPADIVDEQPPWDDAPRPMPAPSTPSRTAVPHSLMTAADMLDGTNIDTDTVADPNDIQLGAVIRHPDYGLGKVISIDGSRQKRTVRVHFFSRSKPMTFRLEHAPLSVVGSPR